VPVRAIKTTTISILAVGLLAGSTVGVAAQDEEAAAAVTGTTAPWSEESAGTESSVDGASVMDGARFTTSWEASDSRLSGTTSITTNWKHYERLRMLVEAANYSLENDGGRWAGTATSLVGERLGETDTVVLHGEDGYEGLTAYVVIDRASRTFNAAILPGGMPPFPEAEAE
jgi:hypothetical protein